MTVRTSSLSVEGNDGGDDDGADVEGNNGAGGGDDDSTNAEGNDAAGGGDDGCADVEGNDGGDDDCADRRLTGMNGRRVPTSNLEGNLD